MKNFGNCLFLFLILFAPLKLILASDVEFYFYPNEFYLGQQAKLEVKAFGEKLFKPKITSLKRNGVTISYIGSGTETQIINFKVSKSQILNYLVHTDKEGKFILPEITVSYDDKIFTSPPIEFEVKGKIKNNSQSFLNPFSDENDEETKPPEVLFHTNKNKTYVGESIVGYYVLYYNRYRHPYLERDPNQSISFPFFLSETLKQVSVKVEPLVNRNGIDRSTLVYEKEIYSLTPLQSGTFNLGSTKFIVGDSLKFISNQEALDVIPARIQVFDLPSPKPKTFQGAVGEFKSMLNQIPKEGYKQNRIYFEILVEGEGGNEGLLPKFESPFVEPHLVSQKKSKSFSKLKDGSFGFYSKATFLFSLKTEDQEKIFIPASSLTFFDPKTSSYKQTKTNPIEINLTSKPNKPMQEPEKTSRSRPVSTFTFFASLAFFLLGVGGAGLAHYKKWQSKFLDWNSWIGNKREIFLHDFLIKNGYSEEYSQFLVRLKRDFPENGFWELQNKLSKSEKILLKNILKYKSIGDKV